MATKIAASTLADREISSTDSSRTSSEGIWWGLSVIDWASVLVLSLLLLAVTMHQAQLVDPNVYRHSIWIPVEFLALLASMLFVPLHAISMLYFLLQANFKQALISLAGGMVTAGAIIFAMWWDAATILYMT